MGEPIREVDPVVFDRVWRLVCEIGVYERHFNTLQQTYRALTSTWLLASIGAAGFILEKLRDSTPQNSLSPAFILIALSGIGVAGGVGILLLWNLDLLVYQRLLDANFVEGIKLENEFPWLPPVRSNMMRVHKNRGIMPKVVWFYSASSSVLLFPVAVPLMCLVRSRGLLDAVLAGIGYILIALAAQAVMIHRTNRIDFHLDQIVPAEARKAS